MTTRELLTDVCNSLSRSIAAAAQLKDRLEKDPPYEPPTPYLKPSIHLVHGCMEVCLETLRTELHEMQLAARD